MKTGRLENSITAFAPARALTALAGALFVCALLAACGSREFQPYSPHDNLLSIAAEFQLLAAQDPYRERPAEDLTGRHIARATLVRLANYESLHPGRFQPEVDFLKAQAFQRLGDFESAAVLFRRAAEAEPDLEEEALRRAETAEAILEARDSVAETPGFEGTLRTLERRAEALNRLADELEDPAAAALARREAEQAEVNRAELLAAARLLLPDGEQQALQAMEALVSNHRNSARGLEHALRLASLYRAMAEQELRLRPPESIRYDADRVLGYLDEAADLLYRVSQADGRPERIVARHELDAVLALRERVADAAE